MNKTDLCKTCSHYWVDYPFPVEHCVGHCEIADEKIGFGKMDEVVPYPCVECPFNSYKKNNYDNTRISKSTK